MSDIAIRVENLGKQYKIGRKAAYESLRERLTQLSTAPFNWLWRSASQKEDISEKPGNGQKDNLFWALKDVNFEIKRGEVVGIIGRNGAGKSTLLKILSRITEPTTGIVQMRGRVGSLLEVGTGFHPELTGRENIYLNGAILGMKRWEISKKFGEIVGFAEVEEFIDTPVKHYSSGMYMRLAFAVAAHLDPDILIVDEVLAVGDLRFQQKCLGKMSEVSRKGRTILFVSHNLSALRGMCSRCLWLDGGIALDFHDTISILDRYIKIIVGGNVESQKILEDDNKAFQLLSCQALDTEGNLLTEYSCDNPVILRLVCRVRKTVPGIYGYLTLTKLPEGILVFESDSYDVPPNVIEQLSPGTYHIELTIPARTIGVGRYSIYLNFGSQQSSQGFSIDTPGYVTEFSIADYKTKRGNNRNGYFSTVLDWHVDRQTN